jgi:hypothetical protein
MWKMAWQYPASCGLGGLPPDSGLWRADVDADVVAVTGGIGEHAGAPPAGESAG